METPDRLAAYLADELDPADRAALDDELAGDVQLRAALAAMRRADEALATLATPTPDEGFDARMDAFIDGVLADLEPAPHTSTASPDGADVDGADDATPSTGRSGWVLAVAASLVLLAGVGIATLQPFGGDDDTVEGSAELSALDDRDADDTATADADDGMDTAAILALPLQPTIVDEQRALDDDQLDRLLTEPALTEVAAAGLDRDTGTDLGLELQRQLGQAAPAPQQESESADDADIAGSDQPPADGERMFTRTGDPVDVSLLADAQRCLGTLLEAGPTAIPAYLESASVDGQQALVFGLVTIDPQDDGFTRREIWTLERGTCQVLRFAQA